MVYAFCSLCRCFFVETISKRRHVKLLACVACPAPCSCRQLAYVLCANHERVTPPVQGCAWGCSTGVCVGTGVCVRTGVCVVQGCDGGDLPMHDVRHPDHP